MVWIRRNLNLIISYGSCNTIMHTISSLPHTKFFSSTGATVAIAVCVIILVVLLVIGITIFYKLKNSGVRYQAANFNAPPHA